MPFQFGPLKVIRIAHVETKRPGLKVMRNVQRKMMPRSARPHPDPAADSYKKADEMVKRATNRLSSRHQTPQAGAAAAAALPPRTWP
jgi:hypothetical protein